MSTTQKNTSKIENIFDVFFDGFGEPFTIEANKKVYFSNS